MDGKTAVVTGASRGLGAAVARAFADAGAHVVICARNDSDDLDAVADEIRGAGGSVIAHRADVRDEYDVERLMETAAKEGGDVDIVAPFAAVFHGGYGETSLAESSYAAFDDTLRTNTRGVFAAVREAVPHLATDARVLIPTCCDAREARVGLGAYAVSKAAAEAVARQFATELDRAVGVVDPGPVGTERIDVESRPHDEAAELFLWAATDAPTERLDGDVLDAETWRAATE